MTNRKIYSFLTATLAFGGISSTFSVEAEQPADAAVRFAPEALEQDGKVTLSPGFSPDGRTIYFAQSECSPIWECPQRLKRSVLTDQGWSKPELVTLTENARGDWPSVSPDGKSLLFSWAPDRPRHKGEEVYEDFDLYSLDLRNENALPLPIDEPDINRIRGGEVRTTRFVNNETAPVLTRSGDLYFWTERLDGVGERDVYMAKANGKGGFEKARPLPAPINSVGRDDNSWVSRNGRVMLISYSDRGGEGATDIFFSLKRKGGWSVPENLGNTVNSRFNDFAGRITPDGESIVFTSDRPINGEKIYQVWTSPLPHKLLQELSK